MARTARLYDMSGLASCMQAMDWTYKKSSAIAMFQHRITQIKCDQQYIGSVSYFSLMTESVKQSCSSVDVSSNMQNKVKFHIWKEKQKSLHVVIESLQIKHCQKGILSFNIPFLFSFFFLWHNRDIQWLYNTILIQHNMPSLVICLFAVLLSKNWENKIKTYKWNISFFSCYEVSTLWNGDELYVLLYVYLREVYGFRFVLQMCLNDERLHFALGAEKLHKSAVTTCTFCKAVQNSIDC